MLSKLIDEDKIQKARKLVNRSERIVITTHISPDGDAIGSSLGLYHFLKGLGKEVTVIVPNRFPSFLSWLNESDHIVVMEELQSIAVRLIKEAELIFCLDYNGLNRINGMKPLLEQSQAHKVMIDHHPFPESFCDVTISHPEVSSTSELVFRFICRVGAFGSVTKVMAEAIYTGMMTDTGNFSYNSNDPEIYAIIKELVQLGIDKDAIYRSVYNTYSEDRMRLMGYTLSEKMIVFHEYHTAVISLTAAEQEHYHHKIGDSEGFVNIPLQIDNVDCSIFAREDKDKVKLSFRSQGSFPVNKLAAEFNGGGHLNAAGGESYATMEETLQKLESLIRRRSEFETNVE